jgi:hypothetical protein
VWFNRPLAAVWSMMTNLPLSHFSRGSWSMVCRIRSFICPKHFSRYETAPRLRSDCTLKVVISSSSLPPMCLGTWILISARWIPMILFLFISQNQLLGWLLNLLSRSNIPFLPLHVSSVLTTYISTLVFVDRKAEFITDSNQQSVFCTYHKK